MLIYVFVILCFAGFFQAARVKGKNSWVFASSAALVCFWSYYLMVYLCINVIHLKEDLAYPFGYITALAAIIGLFLIVEYTPQSEAIESEEE